MKELNDSNAALMLGGRNKFVSSNWVVGMLYYRFSSVISKKGINLLHINLSYLYYDEYKSKIITVHNMVSSASCTVCTRDDQRTALLNRRSLVTKYCAGYASG